MLMERNLTTNVSLVAPSFMIMLPSSCVIILVHADIDKPPDCSQMTPDELVRDAFQCLRGQSMGWQERAKPVDLNAGMRFNSGPISLSDSWCGWKMGNDRSKSEQRNLSS